MNRRIGPLALTLLLLPGVGYPLIFGISLARVIYGSFTSCTMAGPGLGT